MARKKQNDCPAGQFGPVYPDLGAAVAKLRKSSHVQAHGHAVLERIRQLNKQAWARRGVSHAAPNCA